MSQDPLISVVMSVYNGEKYVARAVKSILNQTFCDFEFIIIDDGSTDSTLDILKTFHDKRLHIVEQANQGLANALNKGVSLTCAQYIARQDVDDISLPNRFEEQYKIIISNENLDVVGCYYSMIDGTEGPIIIKPTSLNPFLSNPFMHGSVLIRKESLIEIGKYDNRLFFRQDLDLWMRLYDGNNFTVIPKVLCVRDHYNTNVFKLILAKHYENLVKRANKVSLSKRNKIINNGVKEIKYIRNNLKRKIMTNKINEKIIINNMHHWFWGNWYFKVKNYSLSQKHFKNIPIFKLGVIGICKYILTYFHPYIISCVSKTIIKLYLIYYSCYKFNKKLFRGIL